MNAPLRGSTVVVTGASSGVGRAAALAYAEAGASLVLAARGEDALELVAEACRARGADVLAVRTDVGEAAEVVQLSQAAMTRFGRIDVWANVAGIGAVGGFVEVPLDQHVQVIKTNLLGYLHGAHAALRCFERQGAGTLININSVGGFAAAPYAVAYGASKFGVRGLSLALRSELANNPDIQVCEVYGSFLDTPGLAHAANYSGRKLRPVPPVNDPERVAKVMVELALKPRPEVMLDLPARGIRLGSVALPRVASWSLGRLYEAYVALAERAPITPGATFNAGPAPGAVHGGLRSVPLRALGASAVLAGLAAVSLAVRARRRRGRLQAEPPGRASKAPGQMPLAAD